MGSPAHTRASAKYDAENVIRITIKLNKKTDADIIQALEGQENKTGFLKTMIRSGLRK